MGSEMCIRDSPLTGRNCFAVRSSKGQAGTKKRKTLLEVQIVVYRGANFIAFETEPQDALPDVWYESSQSFPIVTGDNKCQFALQVLPAEPNPIQFDYTDIYGQPQSIIVHNDGVFVGPFVGVCLSMNHSPSTPPVDENNLTITSVSLDDGSHIGNVQNQTPVTSANSRKGCKLL